MFIECTSTILKVALLKDYCFANQAVIHLHPCFHFLPGFRSFAAFIQVMDLAIINQSFEFVDYLDRIPTVI